MRFKAYLRISAVTCSLSALDETLCSHLRARAQPQYSIWIIFLVHLDCIFGQRDICLPIENTRRSQILILIPHTLVDECYTAMICTSVTYISLRFFFGRSVCVCVCEHIRCQNEMNCACCVMRKHLIAFVWSRADIITRSSLSFRTRDRFADCMFCYCISS